MTLAQLNSKFLTIYLFSLVTISSYGISGVANIRFTDFFALLLLGSSLVLLMYHKKIHTRFVVIPMLIFVFLEFLFPLLGVVYNGLSSITTSIRTLLMWMPLVLYWGLMANNDNIERKVDFVLKWGLIINFTVALMQLFISLGYLPEVALPTYHLQIFAVDEHYKLYELFRSSGMFSNSTALSIFGTLAFIYFYSKTLVLLDIRNIYWSFVSFAIVVLTTSRMAVAFVVLILLVGLLFTKLRTKFMVSFGIAILIAPLLYWLETTVIIDEFFWRFTRIYESGLLDDKSFGYRFYVLWPNALEAVEKLPFGTLTSSPIVIGVIDSGYLTYYTQGKWGFIFGLLLLVFSLIFKIFSRGKQKKYLWVRLFSFFTGLYIMMSLVVNNLMRSQLVIVFIILSFMFLQQAKSKSKYEKNTLHR